MQGVCDGLASGYRLCGEGESRSNQQFSEVGDFVRWGAFPSHGIEPRTRPGCSVTAEMLDAGKKCARLRPNLVTVVEFLEC
jgi:hypothetical protein